MSTVVIVGRMNVGKSTLFNRLASGARSITMDYEGVTRDFIKDGIVWRDKQFDMIDCAGINLRKTSDKFLETIRLKVLNLVESADIVLFMTDGKTGLLPEDREISKFLHKLGKKVIVVVNKIDNDLMGATVPEFQKLGHTKLVSISAQHGLGINDLLDEVVDLIPEKSTKEKEEPSFKVVFLGKPNVGKSSLMNLMLKEDRQLVSEVAGTTREAISESIKFYKESILLTDTPGIRRKRAIEEDLEKMMIKSAFYALKHSDIVVLLIDGTESTLLDQELKLAFYAFAEQYKALILLINKHDLMTEQHHQDLERSFDYYKHLINKIPKLFISCKSGKNVGKILPLIQEIWVNYSQKLDGEKLNKIIIKALQDKPLFHQRERLVVYEAVQVKTAPVTIKLEVNEPDWFEQSQLGFLENIIRSEYDMNGVPVKFILKKRK